MSSPRTFKLRHQARGRDENVRRLTLQPDDLHLDTLRAHAAKLFGLQDNRVWYFKWTDEDGDSVSLTESYEFEDLLSSKPAEAVLKLSVFVEPASQPTSAAWDIPMDIFVPFLFPDPRTDDAQEAQSSSAPAEVTVSARCDVTNKTLAPGSGDWYHRPNTRVDLCAEEFKKLCPENQAHFVLVNAPSDLGDDLHAYGIRKCRRFGGRRGCKQSPNCQAKAQRQPQAQASQAQADPRCHRPCGPNIFGQSFGFPFDNFMNSVNSAITAACDQTGAPLHIGQGWFHKTGTNYDLCKQAFEQLSDTEKVNFIPVESVEHLGEDIVHYLGLPSVFKDTASNIVREVLRAVPTQQKTSPSTTEPSPVATPSKPLHQVEVVSGPSVQPRTQVKTGVRLVPVWEVKNSSSAPSNLWTDIRIKPTAENPLQIAEEGFEVPMLEPGATGLVSVDFVVPESLASGLVQADFVFVDSHGDAFGQPLSLTLDIIRPDDETMTELVRQLQEMGFSDAQACKAALVASKGDISAATLALLRAQQRV